MAIVPYLYYSDVDAAQKFLSKAFGFKKLGKSMRGEDGKTSHAAMKYGDGIVMMGRPGDDYLNPKRLGHTTQCLYVNVKNADDHFEHAKRSGAKIIEEPADTEYGHRRYGALDPEGHEWYFAHEIRSTKRRKK